MAKAELTFQKLRQLSPQVRQSLEGYLLQFEQSWHPELISEYVNQIPTDLQPDRLVCLVELVMIDLERQWGTGRCIPVEDYLANFPELGTAETVALDLLLAECQAREIAGEQDAMANVAQRFPKRGTELNEALQRRDISRFEKKPPRKSARTQQATRETKRVAKNKKTAPKRKPSFNPPLFSELPCQFGRYRVEKQLGAGGMGAVYLAHDTQLDRPVALKIPKFEGSEADGMLERFYREARSAATLRHPNICPVYDVDQIEGMHFLTMAYLDGRPLEDYIEKAETIPERTAALLIRKVALGLEQAHAAGVVHRDLKPANIMIDGQKEPVITDFGLARNVNASEESRVTKQNIIMGTPAYMSPEQVDGALDLGPLSDIYSLGVIFYELLTGRLPFNGLVSEVLKGILLKEPPKPSDHRRDLDPEIEAICLKMMAKDPNQRYANAREVVDVLTNYLKGNQRTRRRLPGNEPGEENSRQTELYQSGLSDFLGTLGQKQDTGPTTPVGAKSQIRRSKSRRSTLLSLAAFGLMAAALYGVVLLLRGPDGGTLRVEVDDPNLKVLVDGDSITLKDKSWEGKKAAKRHTLAVKLGDQQLNIGSPTVIHLPDGRSETHRLQMELNGVQLASDTFEITRGKTTIVKITLEPTGSVSPKAVSPNESPSVQGNPPGPIGQTAPDGEKEGWVSLFDGDTLAGWEQHNGTATFQVEDGMIVGKTSEGSPNSFLCSKKNYSDFELKFEVKVDDELNSGVQIRSKSDPSIKNGRVHGLQVEIDANGDAGFIYGEGLGIQWLSSIAARADTKRRAAFKNGEWNRFHVRVEGKSIKTWVNEIPVADTFDDKTGISSGFIGLQVHSIKPGTGPYEVRWRNLELKDLSNSSPNDSFKVGSIWFNPNSPMQRLTVTQRNGETFTANFIVSPKQYRVIKGTVKDGKVFWYAKDVQPLRGKPGGDNTGTFGKDSQGEKIDFVWQDKGGSGSFILRLSSTPTTIDSAATSKETAPAENGQTGLLADATYRDDEWTPLTNGKDLSGWSRFNGRSILWEVQGPVLSARNRSNRIESGGAIFTTANYRDFHFRCEVQALSEGGGMIFFRNSSGIGVGRRRGYGVENLSMDSDELHGSWGIGSLFADDFQVPHDRSRLMPSSQKDLGIKAGDWYRLEIIALGNAVEIRINGQITATYVSSDPRLTKSGMIGFSCGRGCRVVYRNLEIRELVARI